MTIDLLEEYAFMMSMVMGLDKPECNVRFHPYDVGQGGQYIQTIYLTNGKSIELKRITYRISKVRGLIHVYTKHTRHLDEIYVMVGVVPRLAWFSLYIPNQYWYMVQYELGGNYDCE